MNFESAPFKFTNEYLELLSGPYSAAFKLFEDLFIKGFIALQKNVDSICAVSQLFYGSKKKGISEGIRSRLLFAQSRSDILGLIRESIDNWRTKQYDWFQQRTNNILM